jgi:hypothetical protein
MRDAGKAPSAAVNNQIKAPTLFDSQIEPLADASTPIGTEFSGDQREALKKIAAQLLDLREMLKNKPSVSA